MTIKNRELANILKLSNTKDATENLQTYCNKRIISNISKNDNENLLKRIKSFRAYFGKIWTKSSRCWKNLEKKYKDWLDSDFEFPFPVKTRPAPHNKTQNKVGRPKKQFQQLTTRSIFNRTSKIALCADNNLKLLLQTAKLVAYRLKNFQLAKRIELLTKRPDPQKKKAVKKIDKTDALRVLFELELSRAQYNGVKSKSKEFGCDIWPAYSLLQRAKKSCRPAAILFEDNKVEVSLQNLLDHSALRLLEVVLANQNQEDQEESRKYF